MDKYYNHMVGVPDAIRLLYRTRHIFAVWFDESGYRSLFHLIDSSFGAEPYNWPALVLHSWPPFLYIVAFFYEPGLRNLRTPLSHWGTYCIAAGVVLHVLTGIGQQKETTAS